MPRTERTDFGGKTMTRCMGCMAELPDTEEVCGVCGYRKGTGVKEAYYLLPGKIVGKKYMAGKVLGYGGFGVTYIGWDTVLQRKVAIKEYLPSDFATRSYGTEMLTVFSGEATVQFQAGLDSFISEAKRLARFNSVSEIVDIYDCFMENGTGYIIMEFLEGVTVKELLKEKGQIPVSEAKRIVMSVLRGLKEVHKESIIHRDIAPDNIFITKDNEVKILDFGAARYAAAVQSRSLSVILKPGYAPEEQYRSRGEQGPWTDVYALGATFYRMVTGVRPQESIERMVEDHLKTPTELGIQIDANVENAIMNSLNIRKEYRIQDAESFYQALGSEEEVVRVIEEKEKEESVKFPLWIKWSTAAAGVLICVCLVLFATGNISFSRKVIESNTGTSALAEGECYVPDVSGMSYDEAKKILEGKELNVVINGMNYSESIEKDRILSQKPVDGAKVSLQETIYVIMSGGNEEVMMPDLAGMEYEEAVSLLEAQNLVLKEDGITEEYSDVVEKGRIISQNIEAEERIGVRTEITLSVSLGSLSTETAVLTVPDLTGITKKKAVARLEQLKEETGYTFPLGKVTKEYSDTVKKGRIISQSLAAGSEARTNQAIELVISKGPEMVQMPNVVYKTKEEAVKQLEDLGLKVEIAESYSSEVSEGLVISQSINADEKTTKGSTVTLTVSLGKEPESKGTGNKKPDSGQKQPQSGQQPETPPSQPETPPSQPETPAPDNGGGVEALPDNGGGLEALPDDGGGLEGL